MLSLLNTLYQDQSLVSNNDIIDWIRQRNQNVLVDIQFVPFKNLEKWQFEKDTGNLVHDSGKFFSIEGIKVKTDYGFVQEWRQPIINQPEIGFLGIIAKEMDGMLYFLMQAKIEPGNVNCVQLSPTLQATKSNYNRVHLGKPPLYLEYFQNAKPENIILDQLQSEQGARFLRKRNRNIIIRVEEEIPVYDDFCWMSVSQIKQLALIDNIVNMDTRTVLSGILWNEIIKSTFDNNHDIFRFLEDHHVSELWKDMVISALSADGIYTINNVLSWLSRLKSQYDLFVDRIPLNETKDWNIQEGEIVREDRKYFRVIGAKITISNREVQSWCQPLVQPMQEGICAFIIKKINHVYHFLVQAKLECGNFDIFELAPTVQCLTGGYKGTAKVPFLDYVLNVSEEQVLFDTLQSEEGGRFFKEQNRNRIVIAKDDFADSIPDNYIWMTLGQLYQFLKFNNYLNIQARSLISILNFK